jgi:hypothetical protein
MRGRGMKRYGSRATGRIASGWPGLDRSTTGERTYTSRVNRQASLSQPEVGDA